MIVKRKLFSFLDEEGNQSYYLYNESTGEEKLFSVVEEEKLYFLGPISKETAQYDGFRKRGASIRNLNTRSGAISGNEVLQVAKEKGIPLKEALKDIRRYEKMSGKKADFANKVNRGINKGLKKVGDFLTKDGGKRLAKKFM